MSQNLLLTVTAVAACDEEIAEYVRGIGGSAIMTSTNHTRATTRTAEAMECIEVEASQQADVVVMVQGDEPLILPETIAETLDHFSDPTVEIVNIMSSLRTLESFVDQNNVKVVVNQKNDALYFPREPIPLPLARFRGCADEYADGHHCFPVQYANSI